MAVGTSVYFVAIRDLRFLPGTIVFPWVSAITLVLLHSFLGFKVSDIRIFVASNRQQVSVRLSIIT